MMLWHDRFMRLNTDEPRSLIVLSRPAAEAFVAASPSQQW